MVVVAQLVRVLVCGAEGRRFEPGQPPKSKSFEETRSFFCYTLSYLPSLSTIKRFSLFAISQAMAKAYFVLLVKASNSILSTSSVGLW